MDHQSRQSSETDTKLVTSSTRHGMELSLWKQQDRERQQATLEESIRALVVYAGDHKMLKMPDATGPMQLFAAVPGLAPGRLAHLAPIRNTQVCR